MSRPSRKPELAPPRTSLGLVIAGPSSGSGKTTLAMILIQGFRSLGWRVQAFKVGPDYLDTAWMGRISDRPCINLDPVMTSTDFVKHSFHAHMADADPAFVEGMMGFYDGIGNTRPATGSTAHVAGALPWP